MAITGERTAAAGYADDAEWRPRGQRPSRNASVRVVKDDLVTRNGRLSGIGKPPLVLIVEDDPAIRMFCSINLQIEGLRVLEAADGERGLEQARSERPDLVLTDVMMPGLDGFQLAEALRSDERTRQIPLIFLSSEAAPANADAGRLAPTATAAGNGTCRAAQRAITETRPPHRALHGGVWPRGPDRRPDRARGREYTPGEAELGRRQRPRLARLDHPRRGRSRLAAGMLTSVVFRLRTRRRRSA